MKLLWINSIFEQNFELKLKSQLQIFTHWIYRHSGDFMDIVMYNYKIAWIEPISNSSWSTVSIDDLKLVFRSLLMILLEQTNFYEHWYKLNLLHFMCSNSKYLHNSSGTIWTYSYFVWISIFPQFNRSLLFNNIEN